MHNTQSQYSFKAHTILLAMWCAFIAICTTSCSEQSTPRPDGYFRIEPYSAHYTPHIIGGISLQVNDSAHCLKTKDEDNRGVSWLNIVYPRYQATIYLSYIPIHNDIERLMEESIDLVYRQNVITEQVEAVAYEDYEQRIFATLYALSPESATPLQFIATDSISYLLRGALYFDTPVKADSVAPSLHYIETDIIQMIESITHTTH